MRQLVGCTNSLEDEEDEEDEEEAEDEEAEDEEGRRMVTVHRLWFSHRRRESCTMCRFGDR